MNIRFAWMDTASIPWSCIICDNRTPYERIGLAWIRPNRKPNRPPDTTRAVRGKRLHGYCGKPQILVHSFFMNGPRKMHARDGCLRRMTVH